MSETPTEQRIRDLEDRIDADLTLLDKRIAALEKAQPQPSAPGSTRRRAAMRSARDVAQEVARLAYADNDGAFRADKGSAAVLADRREVRADFAEKVKAALRRTPVAPSEWGTWSSIRPDLEATIDALLREEDKP